MSGVVTGVDFSEALMRVDQTGLDRVTVRLLLADGERGVVTGAMRAREANKGGADG